MCGVRNAGSHPVVLSGLLQHVVHRYRLECITCNNIICTGVPFLQACKPIFPANFCFLASFAGSSFLASTLQVYYWYAKWGKLTKQCLLYVWVQDIPRSFWVKRTSGVLITCSALSLWACARKLSRSVYIADYILHLLRLALGVSYLIPCHNQLVNLQP